jgi:hypothetical protein
MNAPWQRVVYAHECRGFDEEDDIVICPRCQSDYADCPCPGPHQDDLYEYEEHDGVLWARLLDPAKDSLEVQLDLFAMEGPQAWR